MFRTLIIALVWPEPNASAAGTHMMDLIDALRPVSETIDFACTSGPSAYPEDLDNLGVVKHSIQVNDPNFDFLIKDLNPDLVIFDRFMAEEQFGWRVADICPEAIRILNTEDLHGLRKSRQLQLSGHDLNSSGFVENDVMKRELASIFRSDLSLIISEFEMDWLQSHAKLNEDQLHYFPLLTADSASEGKNKDREFDNRGGFVMIGNFRHAPNVDAIYFLKEEIWPLIRKMEPSAEVRIYGAYMPENLKKLDSEQEGFYLMGHAENLSQVFNHARILLAPLRFGAGLKGKLMDAMSQGIPFVTTTYGMEGFSNFEGVPSAVADDPGSFAKLAIEMYHDAQRWEKHRLRGFEFINKYFNREDHLNMLRAGIENFAEQKNDLREGNLLGSVFRHQSLQSTKYMSKWIEEKNRTPISSSE
ncbi:MAG: glycosyltransferase family 4 protein [Bacteroidia bacterium]|nr:glycosyltransferase family 4 protein [Bacteroidia bacterium]